MEYPPDISVASLPDPVERAAALTELLGEYQNLVNTIAGLRRDAIDQALVSGKTTAELARSLGVSPGRISQMRRAGGVEPVITGWQAKKLEPVAHIAICGSRSNGTNGSHIDAVIISLARLLMRRRYAVSHGPVGIGNETLTYIADHFKPIGLNAVRGIIGHANVVRKADCVLVVGGGTGTRSELNAALASGKKVLPMPTSGGAAARMYMRQLAEPKLRSWLADTDFSALATADADKFASIAESVISSGATDD